MWFKEQRIETHAAVYAEKRKQDLRMVGRTLIEVYPSAIMNGECEVV